MHFWINSLGMISETWHTPEWCGDLHFPRHNPKSNKTRSQTPINQCLNMYHQERYYLHHNTGGPDNFPSLPFRVNLAQLHRQHSTLQSNTISTCPTQQEWQPAQDDPSSPQLSKTNNNRFQHSSRKYQQISVMLNLHQPIHQESWHLEQI